MALLADGPELGEGIELGRVTGAARRWLVLAQALDDGPAIVHRGRSWPALRAGRRACPRKTARWTIGTISKPENISSAV